MKQFFSAAMAIVLVMSLMISMGVSAAIPKEKLDAMGFVAYRVLDRVESTIPTEPADDEEDTNKVYTVNGDFVEFFSGITPENYEVGKHGDEIWLIVENNILKIVPTTETTRPNDNDVIVLPISEDVTANSADVLAGVLLGEIASSDAKASDAQRLAGWLKAYAEAKKAAAEEDGAPWPANQGEIGEITANDEGKIEVGDLGYGYWLLYSTQSVAGVSNVKVVLEVAEGSQTAIDVKAEYDGLEKTVRNLTDNDTTFEKTAVADAGDILEYKVEFDIQPLNDYPANDDENYTKFKYIFKDVLTNQRLVNYATPTTKVEGAEKKQGAFLIKVEVNGGVRYYVDLDTNQIAAFKRSVPEVRDADVQPLTNIRNANDEAISYGTYKEDSEPHQQEFHVEFNWNSLKTLVSTFGAHVTFMYKAELTSDAVRTNNNNVSLEYSNNPDNEGDYTTNRDETTVFSYGLDITKTFGGEEGTPDLWEDVVFNLYETTLPSGSAPAGLVEGKKISFIEKEKGEPGDYQRADMVDLVTDNSTASYSLKLSKESNTLKLYGLDPGWYILEETSSPNGYLLGGKVYIFIGTTGDFLAVGNSSVWLGDEDLSGSAVKGTTYDTGNNPNEDSLKIEINNKKRNFELPDTGAMGVWLLGIGGVLALAGAVYVYSKLKKRDQHN